jgi:polysaccharide biosynthesis protein PslH
VHATPRLVVIVGAYRWTPKELNLSAFFEATDLILQNAGVGVDIVGEVPDSLRKAWESRVKATRFHGFVENLGEFLAARRMGLVVEQTGGRFKLKTLDYIFNRMPITAIKGSIAGLPLDAGARLFILSISAGARARRRCRNRRPRPAQFSAASRL